MNRASEIRNSLSNIKYELDNDIYNPPKVKDDKPFNMSDYIKPVSADSIPDVEEATDEVEQVAFDEVEVVEADMPMEDIYNSNLSNYMSSSVSFAYEDNNQKVYGSFNKIATSNGDNYTESLIKKNINNFKDNILNSNDKVKGVEDSINEFKEDNKDVLDNMPDVAMDTAEFAVSKMIPSANGRKKARALRNVAEDGAEKGVRLLGRLFAKRAEEIQEYEWEKVADYRKNILRRQRRYLDGRRD